MDCCSDDVPEHVAKIHKTLSMKQDHWDHDGFTLEETKSSQNARQPLKNEECHFNKTRGKQSARRGHSPQQISPSKTDKNSVVTSQKDHCHSKSDVTEPSRNKGRRPDIQVYVPRAKRMQQGADVSRSPKEASVENVDEDKSGNQTSEKRTKRQKAKARPSLEPYVPRAQRSLQQTETSAISQSDTSNVGQQLSKGHESHQEHHNEAFSVHSKDTGNRSSRSESSVAQPLAERSKRSPRSLELADEDVEVHSEKKHCGHHKSKRKHHSKDKDGRDEPKSASRERRSRHHSKHKKHQIKDRVSDEDEPREKPIKTTSEAHKHVSDVEGDPRHAVHGAEETAEHVSSVANKSDTGNNSNEEKEPIDDTSQSVAESCHDSQEGAKTDTGQDRSDRTVSNGEQNQNVENATTTELTLPNMDVLSADENVLDKCKGRDEQLEDKPDVDQQMPVESDDTIICSVSDVAGELVSEKMEVDDSLAGEDESCSVPKPNRSSPVNLPAHRVNVTKQGSEEDHMQLFNNAPETEPHGAGMAITAHDLSSGTSQSVSEENCHETKDLPSEDLESGHCQSNQPQETSQSEKAAGDSLWRRTHRSSQSEDNTVGRNQAIEDDSWDKLYDDTGEALDSRLMEELTTAVGNVEVQKPAFDYYSYQPKDPDIDYDAYGHLIEIYDFPSTLITRDLCIAFKEFEDSGFDIKWVDDNHAIGVFSSAFAAKSALTLQHPLIKVRPLCEATRQTKVKAKKACEFLQPYRPRPETVASVARNLVAGALGIRSKVPKEKRDEERRKLRDAREKKRQSTRERRDAWNGIIGQCAMDDV